MDLRDITPMILAFDERENIGRCLDRLAWAERVVVVDSGSTDGTLEICARYPNVEVVSRAFDTAARQGNFGLSQARSAWVLSLDADYVLDPAFVEELRLLSPAPDERAFEAAFRYLVFGRPLRGALYPPRKVLYRREGAGYEDDGHTQRVRVGGSPRPLRSRIDHDDRKPLSRWFASQGRYARLEAEKLLRPGADLRVIDRLRRRIFWAPWLNFLWCLLAKGALFEGRAGLYYAFQRLVAELMLSICLLDSGLRGKAAGGVKD